MSQFHNEHYAYLRKGEMRPDNLIVVSRYQWVPANFIMDNDGNSTGLWMASIDSALIILTCPHCEAKLHWWNWHKTTNGAQWRSKYMPQFSSDNYPVIICPQHGTSHGDIREEFSCGTGEHTHHCTQKGYFQLARNFGHDQVLNGVKDWHWTSKTDNKAFLCGNSAPPSSQLL
ncbi:hypothetical protein BGW36DRAFT_365794 [Talaromyces proteolyticus]|uniref:Uncharacterized protein n=1 Tax=Talaromyces proteolyticus TaxID=1131652 RepID=A0AAD4KD21_9EURO|nr:uncharacterized protein BGW36DRAFT_365794 [Talaromyces proteolyticus]KAH8688731.1 hypothetical protein BGW36DRAFT_365794 [Talaromyces proteolyticus]